MELMLFEEASTDFLLTNSCRLEGLEIVETDSLNSGLTKSTTALSIFSVFFLGIKSSPPGLGFISETESFIELSEI